jgi:hypothetical protein
MFDQSETGKITRNHFEETSTVSGLRREALLVREEVKDLLPRLVAAGRES